jgi:GC-rich sequence DNA-binding factor
MCQCQVCVAADTKTLPFDAFSKNTDRTDILLSESTIQSAKEKRQKLRQTEAIASDEFISLTVSKRGEEIDEPHPESRLVREEDELGEGDDGMLSFVYKHHISTSK